MVGLEDIKCILEYNSARHLMQSSQRLYGRFVAHHVLHLESLSKSSRQRINQDQQSLSFFSNNNLYPCAKHPQLLPPIVILLYELFVG